MTVLNFSSMSSSHSKTFPQFLDRKHELLRHKDEENRSQLSQQSSRSSIKNVQDVEVQLLKKPTRFLLQTAAYSLILLPRQRLSFIQCLGFNLFIFTIYYDYRYNSYPRDLHCRVCDITDLRQGIGPSNMLLLIVAQTMK